MRYASDMGGQFVRLQYEVIGHIKGIKVLELSDERVTFNLRKFLSFDSVLYGLSLPHSYEDVFKTAIESVSSNGYSASGENFVDISAFRVNKSLKKQ